MPTETTIPNFRHLLEAKRFTEHNSALISPCLLRRGLRFAKGTIADAMIIRALSSTKNDFGTKPHIGSDAEMGLVYSLQTTSANVHDLTPVEVFLTGERLTIFADACYPMTRAEYPVLSNLKPYYTTWKAKHTS